MLPFFSIVIPAYNEEAYIEKCVVSALNQNYAGKFEVIVVDNSSNDATALLAQKAGARVVLENQKGPSAARNRGYLESQGEIIAFMDADCVAPENWLDSFLKPFSNPQIVAVGGGFSFTESTHWLQDFIFKVYYHYFEPLLIQFCTRFFNLVLFSGANFAVRKSALDQMGGLDTDIIFWGDDTAFIKKIRALGKLTRIPFRIQSSARRYNQAGFFKTTFTYTLNHLWVLLRGRPYHESYQTLEKDREK